MNTPAILPGVPTPPAHMPPEQIETVFTMLRAKVELFVLATLPEMACAAAMEAAGGMQAILTASLAHPFITAAVITTIVLLIIGIYTHHVITMNRAEEAVEAQQAKEQETQKKLDKAREVTQQANDELASAAEDIAIFDDNGSTRDREDLVRLDFLKERKQHNLDEARKALVDTVDSSGELQKKIDTAKENVKNTHTRVEKAGLRVATLNVSTVRRRELMQAQNALKLATKKHMTAISELKALQPTFEAVADKV